MRRQIAAIMCSAVLGLMTLSSHAIAQQKTVKACQEEWRANKAANQASGITQKAYVAQCRGEAAPAQSTAPAPVPTVTAPRPATGQKTAKECREEWRANKAANQASGVTEKAYVAQCRGERCTCPTYRGPGTTAYSSPCSHSRDYGTKDCKGVPGRVEGQQGRQSGKWCHGKSVRGSMPGRHSGRPTDRSPRSTAGSSPRSHGGTGCSHSGPYGRGSCVQTCSSAASDRRTGT